MNGSTRGWESIEGRLVPLMLSVVVVLHPGSSGWAADQDTAQTALTNPYVSKAQRYLAEQEYNKAETVAQRALEVALRHRDSETASAMRQLIRDIREQQSEQQQAEQEQAVAHDQAQREAAWQQQEVEIGAAKPLPKSQESGSAVGSNEEQWQRPHTDKYEWNTIWQSLQQCRGTCDASCAGEPPITRTRVGNMEYVRSRDMCVQTCKERCFVQCRGSAPFERVDAGPYGQRTYSYRDACLGPMQ